MALNAVQYMSLWFSEQSGHLGVVNDSRRPLAGVVVDVEAWLAWAVERAAGRAMAAGVAESLARLPTFP